MKCRILYDGIISGERIQFVRKKTLGFFFPPKWEFLETRRDCSTVTGRGHGVEVHEELNWWNDDE